MGTRVAETALAPQGPRVVLADHLPGDAPILLHRVSDLDQTLAELGARGLQLEARVQLPLGPCATFRSPGGQRLGLYQLTRPEVDEHFAGRTDFGCPRPPRVEPPRLARVARRVAAQSAQFRRSEHCRRFAD